MNTLVNTLVNALVNILKITLVNTLMNTLVNTLVKNWCLKHNFKMAQAYFPKYIGISRYLTKILLMKPLTFTDRLIKCEKNAIEIRSSDATTFFQFVGP